MKRLLVFGTAGMGLGLLIVLAGCPPGWPSDDDDASVEPSETPAATPTPPTPTNVPATPAPTPGALTISGDVIAVDWETGEPIDTSEYSQYAGRIVVYAVADPADLSQPVGKMTLVAPGAYVIDVEPGMGQLYVMAVVDSNRDSFITARDMVREAVDSPVTVENESLEDIDIYIEIWTGVEGGPGGGGGGPGGGGPGGGGPGGACAPFDGMVTYESEQPTNLAVAAFTSDYLDILGVAFRQESGPYDLCATIYGASTNLIGYADADGNGMYEPCDPTGLAPDNPYALTEEGASGVDILIEGVGKPDLPMPLPYITISGSVVAHDAYAGTPIVVSASGSHSGVLYATTTIDGPGDFSVRVPAYISGLLLSAITDSNGDGNLDPAVDASGQLPPFDAGGSNMGGYVIILSDPAAATPTPVPETQAPTPEPPAAQSPTPAPESTPVPTPIPVPESTPTPQPEVPPESGISGTVFYTGTVADDDILVISVFQSTNMSDDPVRNAYLAPDFPQAYSITGFNDILDDMGVDSHEFYVTAVLDVGGDLSEEIGPEDVFGVYSADGVNFTPILVSKGTMSAGIDFELGNWTPPE